MRVFYYLRKYPDYGITLRPHCGDDDVTCLRKVVGYMDADYIGYMDSRRSTTGMAFMMANRPILWLLKLQLTISMSTCKAKYMAIVAAG
jgi:hypothetical protein